MSSSSADPQDDQSIGDIEQEDVLTFAAQQGGSTSQISSSNTQEFGGRIDLDFSQLLIEDTALHPATFNYLGDDLQKIFRSWVYDCSALHSLNASDLVVHANSIGDYLHKETDPKKIITVNGLDVPQTIQGLLANGTKYLDALFYLALPKNRRPNPANRLTTSKAGTGDYYRVYNNPSKIGRCMVAFYFYLVIRAAPPEDLAEQSPGPVPAFISKTLNIKEKPSEMSSYLASFSLAKVPTDWVTSVEMKCISQQMQSRLALGVAGYRICSIFNYMKPDKAGWSRYKEAILVARSFKLAGPCWDFHPLRRSEAVLRKYGNINKNCTNLLCKCYRISTLDALVKLKKLYERPTYDPSFTDFMNWRSHMIYMATSPIFPNATKVEDSLDAIIEADKEDTDLLLTSVKKNEDVN